MDEGTPIERLGDYVGRRGPVGRPLRRLVALLTGEPHDLAALVRLTALPRRTVEDVLAIVADDLVGDGDAVAVDSSRVPEYRAAFGYDRLVRTELADPLAARLAESEAVVKSMADLIAQAPPARTLLDHVPATAETAVRRALWLDSTYDLGVLLCLGDHDLTSLAVAQVSPHTRVIVVDVDEATLEFVDRQSDHLGADIRCLHADLRFGLPARAAAAADVVFTDPPYTPEGVELFAARALACLSDREHGRVVVAYGYSALHPTLGMQAQAVAPRLSLAYEAMLPHFNRYDGAQAVGSAADLYVWRPTPATWKGLDRLEAGVGLYTRGGHALESRREAASVPPPELLAEAGDLPVVLTGGWSGDQRVKMSTLLADGIARRGEFCLAAELVDDPGPWLARVLLAANATRVVALVRNSHPDTADRAAQDALTALVGPKYRLRFLRSRPDADHAIVVADALPDTTVASFVLRRAHGKLGNVWRDALVRAEPGLTKREARAAAEDAARAAFGARGPDLLDARPIDLPRHRLAQLF